MTCMASHRLGCPKLSWLARGLASSLPLHHHRPLRVSCIPRAGKEQNERRGQSGGEPAPRSNRQVLEDELRDPSNFLEYLLPRPLRVALFGGSAVSCAIAALLAAVQLLQAGSWEFVAGRNLLVDSCGLALFVWLARNEGSAAQARVGRRRDIRQAQIRAGDREVFYDEQGEKMSRLKEVNEDWILRRLEKWGKRDNMPFLGPIKAALVQQLVRDKQPRLAVEVGTMAGYSALSIARVMAPSARLLSFEKELSWVLSAKRFLWQAGQGNSKQGGAPTKVHERVDVRWGDAVAGLAALPERDGQIEFLLLDGVPKDTLAYLQAAEPHLAPGAVVVADNAVVFAEGGMKAYLAYVRGNPQRYSSRTIQTTLEWREDVVDGLEVSTFLGPNAGGASP